MSTTSPEFYQVQANGSANVLSLKLPTSLDPRALDDLNQSLLQEIQAHPSKRWVLDLSGSSYLGSAMLGMLVNLRHQIRASGGSVALCGLAPQLERVIHACSMDRLFAIFPTPAAALQEM